MFPKSIRWRLQLWLGFLLLCVLSGFGVSVYHLQRVNQLNQLDEELTRRVAALNLAVRGGVPPESARLPPPEDRPDREFDREPRRPPPFRERPDGPPPDDGMGPPRGRREIRLPSATADLFADTGADSYYFAVWSRDGLLLKRSTNAPAGVVLPRRPGRDTGVRARTRDAFRESYQFTELGDCVLAGRSLAAQAQAQRRFAWTLFAVGSGVLALGLGGGWWLATRSIRPIEDISAAARRISAGRLSERIVGTDPDNELGRLASVLNSTFARLESAFAQQKQFTADAAHELRTPIAVLISEAQTILSRERASGEYREAMQECLAVAQQMRRLTESLLELARVDTDPKSFPRQQLDLADQARRCIEQLRPLAVGQGLEIHCDLASASVMINADSLAQVITNLLTNAIHYNKPQGQIRVTTRVQNGTAILTVSDTGVGIAPEDLPHVFERFYRADKARSRAIGHAGLGLAICQAIILSEGGRIEATSQPGVGSTFTVRLPSDEQVRLPVD